MAIFHHRKIAIFFCCLAIGWALAGVGFDALAIRTASAEPSAGPQTQPNRGQLLIRRARTAMAAHRSISAKIHQRIRLYGQELVGNGFFVQGAADKNLISLDLSVKLLGQASYVQQRCDGRFYWEQKLSDGIPTLTRIDVRRVLAARRAAAGGHAPEVPLLGLGGMAFLLEQLDACCLFQRCAESKLSGPEALRVYVIEASWRPERVAAWLPDQRVAAEKGQTLNLEKLPPVFPDRILISLGYDDLFPRRIEYGASAARRLDADEAPLVQIYFEDVQFDQEIEPETFRFSGGVTAPVDGTDSYLMRPGLLTPSAGQ